MTTNTFGESPPRRPTIDDLGGAQKINDPFDRPDPANDVTADDFNQTTMQVAGLARVAPHTRVTYRYASGAYQIARVASLLPGIDLLTAQTLLGMTVVGAGDVAITWPLATFPTPVADHQAAITGNVAMGIACETTPLSGGNLGVRVRTTGGHTNFVLELF